MRFGLISNLIANARCQYKFTAVCKLRLQFAVQAEQYMALFAPVIGQIIWRVLNDSHPDRAKLPRAPGSRSGFPVMDGRFDRRPVGESEGYVSYLHGWARDP